MRYSRPSERPFPETTIVPNDAPVPLLDLREQYASIKDDVDRAIGRVVASQGFIGGSEVAGLEQEIAGVCGAAHGVGCGSGSEAILLAMMAIGVKPGDEVVCPAFTFFATAGSIARLGGVPVFADIDPVSYNMDLDSAREAAGRCRRLAAIIAVHLYGRTADLDTLCDLAEEFGVPLIEDAAQAIGSLDARGRPAGSDGAVAGFSYYPPKNLGGYGDGGMLTTNDGDLAARLRMLRDHGAVTRYHHNLIGLNSRLDAIQAAVLRVKLPHLGRWNKARQAHARHYERAFTAAGAASSATPLRPGGLPLRFPQAPAGRASHIFHQYVIRVPARLRDGLRDHLKQHGIGTEVYYPVPLHLQPCFESLGYHRGDLPHSELAAQETLALPVYPELTERQLDRVAQTIIEFLDRSAEVEVLAPAAAQPAASTSSRRNRPGRSGS